MQTNNWKGGVTVFQQWPTNDELSGLHCVSKEAGCAWYTAQYCSSIKACCPHIKGSTRFVIFRTWHHVKYSRHCICVPPGGLGQTAAACGHLRPRKASVPLRGRTTSHQPAGRTPGLSRRGSDGGSRPGRCWRMSFGFISGTRGLIMSCICFSLYLFCR